MSRSVRSQLSPYCHPKGMNMRELLDEMFVSFSVTLPLRGDHCGPKPSSGWVERGLAGAGNSVAKNMNSFHVLGVRGGHPVLMSSLQTDQQNGPFLAGSPSYLFFLSQEIKQRDKITVAKIYFRVIMCTHLYPFINPMECGDLDDLFKQRGVQQGKTTCPRSQSYISHKIGIQNLVRLRVHTLNCYRESSANRGWKRAMV